MSLFKIYHPNFSKNDLPIDHPCRNHIYIKSNSDWGLLKVNAYFRSNRNVQDLYFRCIYCGDFIKANVKNFLIDYPCNRESALDVKSDLFEKYPNHIARFLYKEYRRNLPPTKLKHKPVKSNFITRLLNNIISKCKK